MNVTVTYYLEVISSWCYWAEPAWAELKQRYARKPVEFHWKIALMEAAALPKSRSQCEWFYRRSGLIVGSPFMLNSGWFESEVKDYAAPNFIAQAAMDLGVTDDRVRLAIADAGLRAGAKVGQWDVCADIAAQASGLETSALLAKAKSSDLEQRVRATTAEFHALQITQRPAFVLESNIGDRAVVSGLVKFAPIAAVLDAMLDDAQAYASYSAHHPGPPTS